MTSLYLLFPPIHIAVAVVSRLSLSAATDPPFLQSTMIISWVKSIAFILKLTAWDYRFASRPFPTAESLIYLDILTRNSADAEIARHASHWMPPKCKTPHFQCPLVFISIIRDHRILRCRQELSCYVPISTFCCTAWSQSTDVTHKQTDGRTPCS